MMHAGRHGARIHHNHRRPPGLSVTAVSPPVFLADRSDCPSWNVAFLLPCVMPLSTSPGRRGPEPRDGSWAVLSHETGS